MKHAVSSTSIIFERDEEYLMVNILLTYWTGSMAIWRNNDGICLLHWDKARVHVCIVAMAKFDQLGNKLFLHPPYFPGLAPSDNFLFQTWNNIPVENDWLKDDIMAQTNAYFQCLYKIYRFEWVKFVLVRREMLDVHLGLSTTGGRPNKRSSCRHHRFRI